MEIRGVRPANEPEPASQSSPPAGGGDDRSWAVVPERRIENELAPPEDPKRGLKITVLGVVIVSLLVWSAFVAKRYSASVNPPTPTANDLQGHTAVRDLALIVHGEIEYRKSHPTYGSLAELAAAHYCAPFIAAPTGHMGYTFVVEPGAKSSDAWFGMAIPMDNKGPSRAFYVNRSSDIYSLDLQPGAAAPRPSKDTTDMPAGSQRLR